MSHERRSPGCFGRPSRLRCCDTHAGVVSAAHHTDDQVYGATGTYPRGFLDPSRIELIASLNARRDQQDDVRPYLFSLIVVDLWIFRRVADFLEDRGLARVGSAHDEDPEPPELLSDVVDLHNGGKYDEQFW